MGKLSSYHIANVAPDVTEDDLREEFGMVAEVIDLRLVMDDLTDRPTGTAWVQMASQHDADEAVRALDGAKVGGRTLRVYEGAFRGSSQHCLTSSTSGPDG